MISLCKKALPFFSEELTWIPGNGQKISIWEDSIVGQPPHNLTPGMEAFKRHLDAEGKITLADISLWREDGTGGWMDWTLPDCPQHLLNDQLRFLSLLHGKAPVALNLQDRRGWGSQSGIYTVAEGYRALKAIPNVPTNPEVWKSIWNLKSMPKVDHFSWLLAHNSVLTAETLQKKGWEGPSQCSLCLKEEEKSLHLFFDCPFAKEVWRLATTPWMQVATPTDIPSFFCHWNSTSPFVSHQKDKIAYAWLIMPKFILWKLWLERNNRIFKGLSSSPQQVVSKAKSLLGDTLKFQGEHYSKSTLQASEEVWLSSLNLDLLKTPLYSPKSPKLAMWEIRKEPGEFKDWRKKLNRNSLFFDGASKGNPGEAGGGGVLYDPEDNLLLKYSWGLGTETNNKAEGLALWQGLIQAKNLGINELTVFGDSRIIIQALNQSSRISNLHLRQTLNRIKRIILTFKHVEIFHILRKLNSAADTAANVGVLLSKGELLTNHGKLILVLP